MSREVPVASREPLSPFEIARLEALCRLSMGAAHALNNAFTTVMGETSFLLEDRKQDPLVAETCEVVLAQLDRCTRMTRALLARRHPSQGGRDEVDLVRLVRELGNLLRETLGSENELEILYPDDLVLVAGDAGALEVLALTLVHYGADSVPGPTRLALCVVASEGDAAELVLDVRAESIDEEVVADFVSADRAPSPLRRAQLQALAEVADSHAAARSAERTGPGAWRARIRFPRHA